MGTRHLITHYQIHYETRHPRPPGGEAQRSHNAGGGRRLMRAGREAGSTAPPPSEPGWLEAFEDRRLCALLKRVRAARDPETALAATVEALMRLYVVRHRLQEALKAVDRAE
jgi:hypothetical protein